MTGTNAESFSAPSFMTPFSLARRSRLIHLCNRFAFTPCESARLAIDTPGFNQPALRLRIKYPTAISLHSDYWQSITYRFIHVLGCPLSIGWTPILRFY